METRGDAEATGMRMDSRQVRPGDLFVCYPPASDASGDSHSYLAAAAEEPQARAAAFVQDVDAVHRGFDPPP